MSVLVKIHYGDKGHGMTFIDLFQSAFLFGCPCFGQLGAALEEVSEVSLIKLCWFVRRLFSIQIVSLNLFSHKVKVNSHISSTSVALEQIVTIGCKFSFTCTLHSCHSSKLNLTPKEKTSCYWSWWMLLFSDDFLILGVCTHVWWLSAGVWPPGWQEGWCSHCPGSSSCPRWETPALWSYAQNLQHKKENVSFFTCQIFSDTPTNTYKQQSAVQTSVSSTRASSVNHRLKCQHLQQWFDKYVFLLPLSKELLHSSCKKHL